VRRIKMSDQNYPTTGRQAMAPSAVAALVLAISACAFGWSYGVPGIILGAIGSGIAKKARAIFDANPGKYRGERIIEAAEKWSRTGIIQGIILVPVWIILIVLYVSWIVSMVS